MEVIDYLKDPTLVASFQRFFGVRIHYDQRLDESASPNADADECVRTPVDRDEGHRASTRRHPSTNGSDSNDKQPSNGYVELSEFLQRRENETVPGHEGEILQNSHYTIANSFWYYLFLFGTELGDEIFYTAFIPFWFWNIDGAVGRRVILVWAIVMTTGQALKDVICWPRPACPPAVRLQNKWSQEYGMPSTHAMIGVSIPFSVVLFTMNRYVYSVTVGCIIALLWSLLVGMSRLYLGMHTVLDIMVGVLLAIALMIPLIPLIDVTDFYIVTNFWVLAILIAISVTTIVYYPSGDKWTPTRGDTTMVVSVTAGVYAGAWFNRYIGVTLSESLPVPPPYRIIWPTYPMIGRLILRTVLGFCGIIATRAICKSLSYTAICAILRIDPKELMKCHNYGGNRIKIFVDLVYKYVACFMIGVNTVYLLPNVFRMIGIERPTFYTEI